jgi:murein L,D-transpeptidase YafK
MRKVFALFFARASVFLVALLPPNRTMATDDFQQLPGEERVASARAARDNIIRERFAKAGLEYPPRYIFLRWFKKEAVIELWARAGSEPFRMVYGYAVLASSGGPGPKRREGDLQSPEGFYEIERFNPESLFHLSMRLNYPNAADRLLSDPDKPGCDIYIHGKDGSTGCAPVGDDSIEELYLIAFDVCNRGQARIPVHIFPGRMSGPEWTRFAAAAIAENPALKGFWEQLQPAYDFFETRHCLPKITVAPDGRYVTSAE